MKDSDFQNLLEGIREAGSYLRGNKKAAARVDHIDPESVAAIGCFPAEIRFACKSATAIRTLAPRSNTIAKKAKKVSA